jgi:myosin-5
LRNAKSDLDPHVFTVADRAYRQMMSENRKSQSILISGESGAGKTESTKIVMSYLTTLGGMGVEQEVTGELSVMQRVLQSNPVLEAFGNARTLRNDNSSRFGKFIELGFSRAGHLLGAKTQTYLLEKVRLAFHASGERNYHIFYQLLRGATDEQKLKYNLREGDTGGVELPNHFHYTKQGGAPHLREFTDESGLEHTLASMRALGWDEDAIDKVLSVIAGILHLGEIGFTTKPSDSGQDAAAVEDVEAMERCAALLGVDVAGMTIALTEKIIVARGEELKKELTPDKAIDARDALAKTIYGALFLWIVDQVNKSIRWESDADVRSSIGVLDIFGFECFPVNSFEQLCINFTNEALQQQFNMFIFKLEQAEYEAEQIEWAFISFPDNQDCLDTIQKSKIGILSMLDDEAKLPKGSDRNWAKRMYLQHLPGKDQIVSDNSRFYATKIQQAKAIFCIRHFAGIVEYRGETNFMEKNKDEIPVAARNLFETAPSQLLRDAYACQKLESEDKTAGDAKQGAKSGTIGQQFKEQLHTLIANVEKTDPHYIRCLKPNDSAKPKILTRKRLTEQLRYGGVLEAVRVARAGYPVRLTHAAFFQRYRMLLPATPEKQIPWNMEGHDAQKLCVTLLVACLEEGKKHDARTAGGELDPHESGISRSEKIMRRQNQPIPMRFPQTDVQLGLTKVFMRKPPHDALESHRVFHQHAGATMIQCWVRGLEQRKRYFIMIDAVQTAQRVYRGSKGRDRYDETSVYNYTDPDDNLTYLFFVVTFFRWWRLRKAKAGVLLTKQYRMQIHRRKYNRSRRGTILYQALFRGFAKRRVLASIKIQNYYRMYRLRTNYKVLKSAVLAFQCAVRVRIAKAVLKSFMGEQKDIGKLRENNEKLKMEMQSLKAMLAAQAKEDASNVAHTRELDVKQQEIDRLEKRVAELEKLLAAEKALIEKMEGELTNAKQQASFDAATSHHKRTPTDSSNSNDAASSHIRRSSAESGKSHQEHPLIHPISRDSDNMAQLAAPNLSSNVSPEVLAQHRSTFSKIEAELSHERKLRREADGEIIKLRAAINGVELKDEDVDALLAEKLESSPVESESLR